MLKTDCLSFDCLAFISLTKILFSVYNANSGEENQFFSILERPVRIKQITSFQAVQNNLSFITLN